METQQNLKLVVAGLLLAIFMAAMDNTIVATAMGTIVADLGGLDKFVWITSAYMVAVMAGMPIFGKLSDMYGRKRFFLFGLIVFLIGSALCGFAQSMVQLAVYRAIQGIGGGALMPIAFTIIFDVFPPENRGKMTGLFGAVFGLSSVFGPLLGAYITEYINWHWVFFVNLPIGVISVAMIALYYKESPKHSKQKIDWWGAITLVAAIISLMFALELGGKEYEWASAQIIGLFATFAVFFIAFLVVETKAEEPIISFWMFKKRLFATSQILAFLYGATFVILTIYIPIFVQAVYGGSATNAGLILMPMMLGSVAGSGFGGAFQTKMKFRSLMTISVIAYVIGFGLLTTLTPDTSRIFVTLFMILAGFGVGFSFSLLPSASVYEFDARHRGSANSTNSFFRSLGMTIGITIFGLIQNNIFTEKLKEAFKDMSGQGGGGLGAVSQDPRALFESSERAKIPSFVLDKIVDAMSVSITSIFMWALIPIVIAIITVFFMGNAKVEITKGRPTENPEKLTGTGH